MNRLKPLIEQAQGAITPDALQTKVSEWPRSGIRESKIHAPSQPKRHEHGSFHEILFYLLLLGGLITAIDFFYNHITLTLLGIVIGMGVGVCVIVALVRQHNSNMKGALRGMTWGTLGYVCFSGIVGYIYYMILAVKNAVKAPGVMNNQWEWVKMASSISPLHSPWLTSIYIFSIVCSFVIGLSGLISMRRFRCENPVFPAMQTATHGGEAPSRAQVNHAESCQSALFQS